MGRIRRISNKPSALAKQIKCIIKINTGVDVEPVFNRVQTRTFGKGNVRIDGLKWYMLSYDCEILIGSTLTADDLKRCKEIKKIQLSDKIILLEGN